MAKFNELTQHYEWDEPKDGSFDWTPYDDGWNGTSLKVNKNIKTKNNEKVFSHEFMHRNCMMHMQMFM